MTDTAVGTDTSSHWRRVVAWAGVPLMIGALNEFALVVALPSVRREFSLSVADVRWLLLVFVIADAAVLIVAGRYGDRVGRRRTATIGLALVVIGSLICAVVPTFALLLVGRVVEGVGVGVLFSGLLAIIADAVPRESVGRAFGLWALVGAVAVLVSPIIGGALAEHTSWRWIFVVNAAISVAALLTAGRVLPNREPVAAQRSTSRPPLLASPNFAAGTAVTALVYLTMALTWLSLVFFLTTIPGLSLTTTGLMFVAYGIWWLILPPFTGKLADRSGVRRPLLLGIVLCALGFVGLALAARGENTTLLTVGLCVLGIGVSFVMPAANKATMAQVPAEIRGDASGVNMTARMIGTIIGLLVSSALLASASRDDVAAGAHWAWALSVIAMLVALAVVGVAIRETAPAE